eukprot:SM000019S05016  [mRNA]  locus=s19:538439:543218:+ [translate_table: standard]
MLHQRVRRLLLATMALCIGGSCLSVLSISPTLAILRAEPEAAGPDPVAASVEAVAPQSPSRDESDLPAALEAPSPTLPELKLSAAAYNVSAAEPGSQLLANDVQAVGYSEAPGEAAQQVQQVDGNAVIDGTAEHKDIIVSKAPARREATVISRGDGMPEPSALPVRRVIRPRRSRIMRARPSDRGALQVSAGLGAPVEALHGIATVLDKDNLKNIVKNKFGALDKKHPIVVTFANFAYLDFLSNWLHHVHKLGTPAVLVGALDEATYKWCSDQSLGRMRLGAVSLKAMLGEDLLKGAKLRDMGATKVALLLALLEHGRSVVLSDADTVWLQPLQGVTSLSPAADLLVASECLSPASDLAIAEATAIGGDAGWYREATSRSREALGNIYDAPFSTGAIVARPTDRTQAMLAKWLTMMVQRGHGWPQPLLSDQDAFNRLARVGMFPLQVVKPDGESKLDNRVFWAFNRTVHLGVLPVALFPSSHVYFVQKHNQAMPMAVHVSQAVHGDKWGQKLRLQGANLWALDEDSYYQNGSFLSFDASLPVALDNKKGDPIARQLAYASYVLLSVRNALAIASILKRILILPDVICICDQKVIGLVPRTSSGSGLVEHPTDQEVKQSLQGFDSVRVLHLRSTASAFCRHEDEEENLRFDRDTLDKGLFGPVLWCSESETEDNSMEVSDSTATAISKLLCRQIDRPPSLSEKATASCYRPADEWSLENR